MEYILNLSQILEILNDRFCDLNPFQIVNDNVVFTSNIIEESGSFWDDFYDLIKIDHEINEKNKL